MDEIRSFETSVSELRGATTQKKEAYSSILKMEAICPFDTSVSEVRGVNNPEGRDITVYIYVVTQFLEPRSRVRSIGFKGTHF